MTNPGTPSPRLFGAGAVVAVMAGLASTGGRGVGILGGVQFGPGPDASQPTETIHPTEALFAPNNIPNNPSKEAHPWPA